MTTAVGAQGYLGIAQEASFGSGVASLTSYQTFFSESLTLSYANIYSDRVQSVSDQVGSSLGNISVAGDVSFPLSPKVSPIWFACALGQDSSPFHSERPLNSMVIEVDHVTSAVQASGCMIESFNISSAQGGELTASASIQAKGMSKITAGTPVYSGDNPYVHSDAVFTLNGTIDTSITTWNVTIANNNVTDLYGTNNTRIDIPAGAQQVTGSFTKLFDDVVERDAFLNATVRSFHVKFTRGSNFLTVWCPTVRYDTHTENISGKSEYILETFSFTAYAENITAANKSIRISGDFS